MRPLYVLLIAFFLIASVHGQTSNTGSVRGTVRTNDDKPAAYVTVSVKENKRNVITDERGYFNINRLPAGIYHLQISFTGYETVEREVNIHSGVVENLPISLRLSEKQLDEVTVIARRNRFLKPASPYTAKMPLKDLENAQVVNTVSDELIKEQMLTSFNDALKNVPGLTVLFANQAYGSGTYAIRGFSAGATLRNGLSGSGPAELNLANIERVEVLKGPSGTLFGSPMVSWGGLINRVTKKPYEQFGGEVGYTGGSYGLNRITADVNVPLNHNRTVLFRANAAYTTEGSFQDAGFTRTGFIAPVIEFRPNNRLSVRVEAELQNRQGTTPFTLYAFSAMDVHSPKDLNLDYKRSFTNNEIIVRSPTANLFGEVNYQLSANWTSQTFVSATNGDQNGPYLWNSFSSSKGDTLTRTVTDWNKTATTFEIQQNFVSDYRWGNFRNRMVAGLDFYNASANNSNFYVPFDKVSLSNPGAQYTKLTADAVNAIEATMSPSRNTTSQNVYAVYVSDVFNITDQLILNAALRLDRFDNQGTTDVTTRKVTGRYSQNALSPKFGIVYQLVKDQVSLFSNYSNGFRNNSGTDFEGNAFKPSQGNQFEVGVKTDAFGHRLSATISYYNIHANNLLQSDPAHPGFSVQSAEQWSKGFEANVIAAPVTGLNLVAGYSHNDFTLKGPRPNSAGPANTANFYASYRVANGNIKGLGLSFGVNHYSETTIVTGFTLPAYTLLNASVFYDNPAFRVSMKADNLGNIEYWTGWNDMAPQMPRRISAAVAIKF